MKKTVFWLLPLLAIAFVAAFFLLNPGKETDPPATDSTKNAPGEPLPANTKASESVPAQAAQTPAETPATATPDSTAARSSVSEIAGRQIQGRLQWKGGALPQGLEIRTRTAATVEGKKEFPGIVSEDGSFRIPVPEKFFMGRVSAESDFHFSESVEVHAQADKSFPEITLTLKVGGCLRGIVSQPDGQPAAGAKVLLARAMDASMWSVTQDWQERQPKEMTADEQGRFVFRGQPEGKERLVRASRTGFGPVLKDSVAIQAMRTTEIALTLTPECVVEGLILDASDKPVEGAKVQALPPQNMNAVLQQALLQPSIQGESTAQSASDGSFRIGRLASGPYRIHASKKGLESASTESMTLASGEKKSALRIRLGNGQAIAGRVVNDKNESVVDAKIEIQPDWMSGEFGMDAQWNAQSLTQETSTDETGRFRFDGLGKGAFSIEASHDAHGMSKRDRVRPGAPEFEIKLLPQGTVRGKITAAGIGAAISKFTITATKKEGFVDRGVKTQPFEEKTGQYELKNLPPGSLKLRVSAEGFASESREIEVRSGETLEGIDFSLTPAATVRGRVLAAGSGEPIAGAQVSVAPSSANPMGFVQDMMDQNRAVAQSNEEGTFELGGLAAGKIALRATHADFASGNSEEIELAPGGTMEDIVISLSSGGGIDGFVYDDEGAPVRGASVMAFGMQTGTFKSGKTDDGGYFLFEKGLSPGQYQITSMNSLPQPSQDGELDAATFEGMKNGFAQVEEGKIARIVLGQRKEGLCTVSGRVLAGGQPVAGAMISVIPKANSEAEGGTPSELSFAQSGKDGNFTMKNVVPGKQTFSVQRGAVGGSSNTFEVEVPKTSEHRVEFTLPGGRIAGRVTDARSGEAIAGVWVMVSPVQTGSHLERLGAGLGQAQTDAEGRFQIDNLKAGTYRVSAGQTAFFPGSGGQGLGRATRSMALSEGQAIENADFALRPAATVEGSVLAAGLSGKAIAGASIHFLDESGESVNPLSLVTSNEMGKFQDETLSAGNYTVTAQAPGFVAGSQKVSVSEGGKTSVQIVLTLGTKVSVKLTDAAGATVEGVTIQLFDDKGKQISNLLGISEMMAAWTSGQKSGIYELGTFAPGNYRVLAQKDGKTALDTTIKVEAGSSQTIELKTSP